MSQLLPFDRLVEDHGAVVWRICRSMLGADDAEDAWADTFLSALRSYEQLEEGSNPAAWLTTIAQNRCLDELRRRGRRVRTAERFAGLRVAGDATPGVVFDDAIGALVAGLPERQRLAVAYRYLADLSYPQVAERIGCSVPAARRNAADGIASLRRRLDATAPSEDDDAHC